MVSHDAKDYALALGLFLAFVGVIKIVQFVGAVLELVG